MSGALRPVSRYGNVTMDGGQYAAGVQKIADLEHRVNDLLLANNREVEARREYKGKLAEALQTVGKGQIEATKLRTQLRDMTHSFERSQDELATVTADRDEWIAAFRDLNARYMRLENSVSARPAPDKGAADEYVLGPWVEANGKPDIGDDTLIDIRMACETADKHQVEVLPVHRWCWSLGQSITPTHYRRAYRIGEWHDWSGDYGCPFPDGTAVTVEYTDGRVAHIVIADQRTATWGGVRRFRPTGSPQ